MLRLCAKLLKKCLSDKLVTNLEQKIKKLEVELLDMREWAKFLLSANPTLRRTFTLQNNLPPDYSTSQSQPSFIQMLLKTSSFQITHILRKHHAYALKPQHLTLHPHYPTMQAPQYETPLHQVPWHHAPLMPFPKPPYQMSLYQRPPMPYLLELRQT